MAQNVPDLKVKALMFSIQGQLGGFGENIKKNKNTKLFSQWSEKT